MRRRRMPLICLAAVLALQAGAPAAADDWWAVRPPDPGVLREADLDGFIRRERGRRGLPGSPPADRRTLIRRVSYDLTGLPPTPDEVRAFAEDASTDAYPRLIERLLASPHYGERWARHWLDVARYSDTKGYVYAREEKRFVHAAPYRDWVVRALNRDLPYDRFLELQIAADQLVPAASPDLAAMGFLTLGRRFLGVTHDIIDDRIDVVTRGALGLTVACARCHDHKYDPIPTRDYYALYGVFQSCAEELVPCAPPAPADSAFGRGLAERRQKLRETLSLRREEQMARLRASVAEHLLAQLELDRYPEENFGQILDLKDLNPAFVRRWQQFLAAQPGDSWFGPWNRLAGVPPAEFARTAGELAARSRDPRVTRLLSPPPADAAELAGRYGKLCAEVDRRWRQLRSSRPGAGALPDAAEESLRQALHGEASPCWVPDEAIANIEMYFPSSVVVELWKLQSELDRWLLQAPEATAHASILVDRARPATPRVFKRGNPLTKGEAVPRHFLSLLGGAAASPFRQGSGRLELARAITRADNPLTARVLVNRVWAHHFGRGLVTTPSDFGTRAEPPSHPELLDWLALRFVREGWSLKKLHRWILLSETYRQSSAGPAEAGVLARAQEQDPDNRWLWRMTPRRLGFEELRDGWLAAAQVLDRRVGGPPAPLFEAANRRRTVYALIDRENLPGVLRSFDFANPDLSIPQRSETTVPQQALFGLNHPFVAGLAADLMRSVPEDVAAERIGALYERLYQRRPSATELAASLAFVQQAPPQEPEAAGVRAWSYGYGAWDEATGRLRSFTRLPHFNGVAWQGGESFPDARLGWLQLTASGGHPGNDRSRAVVRRWTAPQAGEYALVSTLVHEPQVGDGIRAFISHSRLGLLRSAALHHRRERLDLSAIAMHAGDTLDFIVDIGGGLNSDQFLWIPEIRRAGAAGSGGDEPPQLWRADRDFAGASPAGLDAWQQLAQVLMLANECLFVD